jgi:hypothetical protein
MEKIEFRGYVIVITIDSDGRYNASLLKDNVHIKNFLQFGVKEMAVLAAKNYVWRKK